MKRILATLLMLTSIGPAFGQERTSCFLFGRRDDGEQRALLQQVITNQQLIIGMLQKQNAAPGQIIVYRDIPYAAPRGDLPYAPPKGDIPYAPPRGDIPYTPPRGDIPYAPPKGDLPPATPKAEIPPPATPPPIVITPPPGPKPELPPMNPGGELSPGGPKSELPATPPKTMKYQEYSNWKAASAAPDKDGWRPVRR